MENCRQMEAKVTKLWSSKKYGTFLQIRSHKMRLVHVKIRGLFVTRSDKKGLIAHQILTIISRFEIL